MSEDFWRVFREKAGLYAIRTQHFEANGQPKFINALVKESSPYLLQHAHNPVNWMAWGDEAFERSEAEKKPVFLSIGYATCHWCHVMEHESFENLAVANFLNQNYVCIKVDREQHPVVDDFYMTALQLIAGQGGWPTSVFLTSKAEPFMAGTYFRPEDFLALLQRINHLWLKQQADILAQAHRIQATVSRYLSGDQSGELLDWDKASQNLSNELMAMVDTTNGGFGGAPKFPQEAWLQFLLYRYLDTHDEAVGNHLCQSLKIMQTSGIHDVLAGGFHRYTVDETWMVPHFEKMLYNQAQLLLLYAQASVVFEEDAFVVTARAIVHFVSHEMQAHNGLFYAGLDADSEDEAGRFEEGAYYTWSWDEWVDVLTESELQFLQRHFDVYPEGNFEGKNILHGIDVDESNGDWSAIKKKLTSARKDKKRPITDHKAILSWNAMMIESLAWAGQLLDDDGMKKMALSALEGLIEVHQQQDEWQRISVNGKTSNVPAVLSDLANLAAAMWAVHATGLKQMAGDLDRVLSFIQAQFWRDGHLIQAQENNRMPPLVNAKDGATVSATAKLLMVLNAFNPEKWQLWQEQIYNSLHTAITKQNTAHAGIFTAQLQQKNHQLGQRQMTKMGLRVNWKRSTDGCLVQIDACENWHHNEMLITLDKAPGIHIKQLPFKLNIQPEIHAFTIHWVPCDEHQCWPKQKSQFLLK